MGSFSRFNKGGQRCIVLDVWHDLHIRQSIFCVIIFIECSIFLIFFNVYRCGQYDSEIRRLDFTRNTPQFDFKQLFLVKVCTSIYAHPTNHHSLHTYIYSQGLLLPIRNLSRWCIRWCNCLVRPWCSMRSSKVNSRLAELNRYLVESCEFLDDICNWHILLH